MCVNTNLKMATLQKADSGYAEEFGDLLGDLKSMLTNFQNTFLTEIKATNDKLDDLTERVSRIEMKLYGEDNQTLTPGVDRALLRGRGPVNMLSGRTRPKIKRLPAVDLSDDIDTSSSDGSFRMKLDVNDLPDACASLYKDVLIQEHETILKDIDLSDTDILDRLISEEAITASDAEDIRRGGGRREKARSLLLMLEQRGHGSFVSFMEALEPDYRHINTTLKRSLSIMYKEKKHGRLKCIVCKIIENVPPREVIDKCYTQKVIPTKVMRDINQCGDPKKGWEQLRPHIKNEEAINVLADSLLPKFKGLREEFDKFSELKKFSCFCKRLSIKRKIEESKRQDPIPQSPVEHSEAQDLSDLDKGVIDNDMDMEVTSEENTNSVVPAMEPVCKFKETGFRDKFNRQAIRKKDMKERAIPET